ncbi:MAG: PilZ domain-containing protein [Terriglobia bacterium]
MTRATRFALQFPVYYREQESTAWFEGRTENISQTGLLFRGAFPLRLQTTVELKLDLIAAMKFEVPAQVHCKGEVVRVEENLATEFPAAVAIAIKDYRLIRRLQSGGVAEQSV